MDRVGFNRTLPQSEIVIIDAKCEPVIINELVDLRLNEILRNHIDGDVEHRQPIDIALARFVPMPNVRCRQTGGVLARASGRIKKFEEDNVTREIAQLHRRIFRENAAGIIGPLISRVEGKVRDDLADALEALCRTRLRTQPAYQAQQKRREAKQFP